MRVVIDTNVFVAAIMASPNAARSIIRLCLEGQIEPLMGNALLAEYEDVMSRDELFGGSVLGSERRSELLDAFLSVCRWTPIYFLWRPNLRDEADNHLVELAIAGAADYIVTRNRRDMSMRQLRLPTIGIIDDVGFMTRWENRQ
ncbi:MAG TPA: putative toxin-antitoxin system toxin component, PIN family [Rhizobiaceae bacterium]|nr:putative toxin-antitoxin system toxin component, PIN family [Rhizobiaceae bacterium]